MKIEKPWLDNFKKDFQGKKILIMGLGVLGRGAADARFFAQIGAEVTVTDLKSAQELKPSLKKLKGLGIKFVLGKHQREDILNSDLILRNAAVPQNSPFLKLARRQRIRIEMDEPLFIRYAPIKVIGITGTRGKSTTTTLIYQILKAAGFPVWLAGNIRGKAALPLLPKINLNDWVVMELSSWQLQGFRKIKTSPYIAVLTNIYEDHLNRYKNMGEYMADKKLIFKYQNRDSFLIINKDLKITRNLTKEAKSKIVWFSRKDLMSIILDSIRVRGEHNKENIAAALKVAEVLKINKKIVKKVIAKFTGLPHRLETVARIYKVVYVNDSTSTTPAAGLAALNAFQAPIILICGGASKNLDMSAFAKEIGSKVKKVIFLAGSETDNLIKLVKKFKGESKITGVFKDLKSAVLKAKKLAVAGDVVLLSPGCASFGMFINEFDRGEKFTKIVMSLRASAKQS